jgi:hypothetical protein
MGMPAVYIGEFPSSPSPGVTHTHNGVTYKWNGFAWDVVSSSGGGGDGGSGGGGGGDCTDCYAYVDTQVEDEAQKRFEGDDALGKELDDERNDRLAVDAAQQKELDKHDAAIQALSGIGDGGEIDLDGYATEAALQAEIEEREKADNELSAETANNATAIAELDESIHAELTQHPDMNWVLDNTADPDKVADKNHNHDGRYAKENHTHDEIEIDLSDYAKGKGITFTTRAGNLYVKWS